MSEMGEDATRSCAAERRALEGKIGAALLRAG
jgi:hypothetical protein